MEDGLICQKCHRDAIKDDNGYVICTKYPFDPEHRRLYIRPRIDFITIGSTPTDEDCLQVGQPGVTSAKMIAECKEFIRQIRVQFGNEPEGVELKVKANQHEFGTYYEVAIYYDASNAVAFKWALDLENNTPKQWLEGFGLLKEKKKPKSGLAVELSSLEEIITDGERIVECVHCGQSTEVEPDATEFWCDGCNKLRKCARIM